MLKFKNSINRSKFHILVINLDAHGNEYEA